MSTSRSRKLLAFTVVWLMLLGGGAVAYKLLIDTDEPGPQANGGGPGTTGGGPSDALQVPFILWGGDVATFLANGGLETKPGTIFARHGLKLKLTPGDDFGKQVDAYLKKDSPFLRGTMSMLAQASEKLCAQENTRPVVFLQLTWSAGDHLVARADCKTLDQLKGKRIALQKGGPHVGMLNDVLRTAKLEWTDIRVTWTDDVTGDKGPAALFRKDGGVDACFAITPDMLGLAGGVDQTGTGVKGTVPGAHVLVSTVQMSRSIADVYACRKDFYDANKELVEKFAAAYLKAAEELLDLKKRSARKEPAGGDRYKAILKMAQDIYGKEALPTEEEAAGLVDDAVFVGLPGNVNFFTRTDLDSFAKKQQEAMAAATAAARAMGEVTQPQLLAHADFDYARLKQLGGLAANPEDRRPGIVSDVPIPDAATTKQNTIFSFAIPFDVGEATFPPEKYGAEFERAVQQATLFGKTVIAVRGHADLAKVLTQFVKGGLAKGLLEREGKPGNYQYYLKKDRSKVDLNDTRRVVEMARTGQFDRDQDPDEEKPSKLIDACVKLSQDRATDVRKALIDFARSKNYHLDEKQIRAVGVGILEPLVPTPRVAADAARNRRVEFSIVRVSIPETFDPDAY